MTRRFDIAVFAQKFEIRQPRRSDIDLSRYPKFPAAFGYVFFCSSKFGSIFLRVTLEVIGMLDLSKQGFGSFSEYWVGMVMNQNVRNIALWNSRNCNGNRLRFKSQNALVELQEQHVFFFEKRLEGIHLSVLATGEATSHDQMVFGNFPYWHRLSGAR